MKTILIGLLLISTSVFAQGYGYDNHLSMEQQRELQQEFLQGQRENMLIEQDLRQWQREKEMREQCERQSKSLFPDLQTSCLEIWAAAK